MFAVAGVMGHTGSAAARHLLERGHGVRVIVRRREQGESWFARGAEVAAASLDDASVLAGALRGIEAAYLLLPPRYADPNVLAVQARIADAIAEAVHIGRRRTGRVPVVARCPSGTAEPARALHYAEQQLKKADIYQNKSRYVVMFISEHYVQKAWPQHERQHAQARALVSKEEYILPARFDDTAVPGMTNTVGHVDLRKTSAAELTELILAKLGKPRPL